MSLSLGCSPSKFLSSVGTIFLLGYLEKANNLTEIATTLSRALHAWIDLLSSFNGFNIIFPHVTD